jgi:hypothetical protein
MNQYSCHFYFCHFLLFSHNEKDVLKSTEGKTKRIKLEIKFLEKVELKIY